MIPVNRWDQSVRFILFFQFHFVLLSSSCSFSSSSSQSIWRIFQSTECNKFRIFICNFHRPHLLHSSGFLAHLYSLFSLYHLSPQQQWSLEKDWLLILRKRVGSQKKKKSCCLFLSFPWFTCCWLQLNFDGRKGIDDGGGDKRNSLNIS